MDDPVWVELRAQLLKPAYLVTLDKSGNHFPGRAYGHLNSIHSRVV